MLVLLENQTDYPTDKDLDTIENCDYSDFAELLHLISNYFSRYGKFSYSSEGDHTTWSISTGGWSGCEDIIYALQKNKVFWLMCWFSSQRGGHYIFITNQLNKTI